MVDLDRVSILATKAYQTLDTNFSKTSRQKLKVNLYPDRARLTLQEYKFNLNFCPRVFEKLILKVWLWYGTVTSSGKQV